MIIDLVFKLSGKIDRRFDDKYLVWKNGDCAFEKTFKGLPLVLDVGQEVVDGRQDRQYDVAKPLTARTQKLVLKHLPDGRAVIKPRKF